MNKTGIELIAQERQEQIEVHKISVQDDVDYNTSNQLLNAIMMIATNIAFQRLGIPIPIEALDDLRPEHWDETKINEILAKSQIGQLQILGAFAAAEIDRLQLIESWKIN